VGTAHISPRTGWVAKSRTHIDLLSWCETCHVGYGPFGLDLVARRGLQNVSTVKEMTKGVVDESTHH
jgi:hypothetical protein